MMTEIQTMEVGRKDVSLLERTTLKKFYFHIRYTGEYKIGLIG